MTQFFSEVMKWRSNILLSHQFDKVPTTAIIIFEIFVVVSVISLLFILSRYTKKVIVKFLVISLGILIFEFFTSPMWLNYKMGAWAYIYQDVSWILTIGWSIMVLSTITMIDNVFPALKQWKRFILYLVMLTVLVLIFESIVIKLGIRRYSPETQEVAYGYFFFGAPIGALYYVPVFMSLVIGFYKYWNFMIDGRPLIPIKRRKWFEVFGIILVTLIIFEIMIDPMARNVNFPRWSYIYRDVDILLVGTWAIIVWLSINFVDKFFIDRGPIVRFIGYLLAIFILVLPIEAWLIRSGFIIFSATTTAGFSGFQVPGLNIPIEVAFAIPFYYSLIVSFIKYWESLLYNKRLQ